MADFLAILFMLAMLAFVILLVLADFRQRKSNQHPVDRRKTQLVCAYCGYDLRETPHRCPECGALVFDRRRYLDSLSNDWPGNPIKPRPASIDEELVTLVSTSDHMEAQLLCEQLEARGISTVSDWKDQSGYVPGQRRIIYHHVQVYEGDIEAAREYLARAQGIPFELWEEWLAQNKLASNKVTVDGDV